MKVTKKTESLFELEFDECEMEKLKDLESVLEICTEDILHQCFERNFDDCTTSFDNMVARLRTRIENENGNTGTDIPAGD